MSYVLSDVSCQNYGLMVFGDVLFLGLQTDDLVTRANALSCVSTCHF